MRRRVVAEGWGCRPDKGREASGHERTARHAWRPWKVERALSERRNVLTVENEVLVRH
jgi:hypothetical protein